MIILRTLGLLLAFAVMVGFGACGLLGLVVGASKGFEPRIMALALLGLGIAGWIAQRVSRGVKSRGVPPKSTPPRE
ncbi:hypothetical protein CR152_07340 [Massilia violaceinigra]|uniref:Uncharacterized protein n=1 Tax=Massilia violaceinigra TaxID=2045208 RepID=A0A2D2DH90_9BURK|nr:hypothetical protein [Massilia violaceinigra]ATQ74343.1 hypothetical protein CR152_07340 [Massilia violaceinigra]